MLQGGAYGAMGGAVFHGMDSFFGANPNLRAAMPVAHGAVGGTFSKMSGGQFSDGFYVAAGSSLAMMGWQAARESTNRSSAMSEGHPYTRGMSRNTVGTRKPIHENGKKGYLPLDAKMPEGKFDISTPHGSFVNKVSKIHDQFNRFRYNQTGNFVPFRTRAGATAFQIHNVVGMPVAATVTGFALGMQNYQPALSLDYTR